jgi:hypothetical protein
MPQRGGRIARDDAPQDTSRRCTRRQSLLQRTVVAKPDPPFLRGQVVGQFHLLSWRHRNPLSTHVVHGEQIGRLERIERDPEQLGVLEREVMVIGHATGAGFCEKTVRKGITERVDTTTRPGACFKNRDVVPCPVLSERIGLRMPLIQAWTTGKQVSVAERIRITGTWVGSLTGVTRVFRRSAPSGPSGRLPGGGTAALRAASLPAALDHRSLPLFAGIENLVLRAANLRPLELAVHLENDFPAKLVRHQPADRIEAFFTASLVEAE